ncbi:MAG: hypothetical protein U0441_29200 [Polyangiaceae bacterium]
MKRTCDRAVRFSSALSGALLLGLTGCAASQATDTAQKALQKAEEASCVAKVAQKFAGDAQKFAGDSAKSVADPQAVLEAVAKAAKEATAAANQANGLLMALNNATDDKASARKALEDARLAAESATTAANQARKGAEDLQEAARKAAEQKAPQAAIDALKNAANALKTSADAAVDAAAAARRNITDAEHLLGTSTGAGAASVNDHTIHLGSKKRVVITLPQMPPTRTYCTFDEKGGNESVTVDWDPLAPRSLVRSVTLGGDDYQISCHSEPARQALDAEVDFSWRFIEKFEQPNDSTPGALHFCDPRANTTRKECSGDNVSAEIKILEKRSSGNRGGLSVAGFAPVPALGTAQRAFGGLSDEALNELFQVIAEVVVERAQSKGLKIAQDKLQQLLCKELVQLVDKSEVPLLPRTCDAVRAVRLEDLAGTGRQLLDSLTTDLVTAALKKVVEEKQLAAKTIPPKLITTLVKTIEASLDAAMGRQERLPGAAARLLISIGEALDDQGFTDDQKNAKNALQVAFLILEECHGSARCDATRIERLATKPGDYFGGVSQVSWPALSSFVTTGLRILSPPAGTTELEQLRGAVGLVMDTLDLLTLQSQDTLSIFNYKTTLGTDSEGIIVGVKGDSATTARLIRDLLQAAVQQDLSKVVTAAVRLIQTNLDEKKSPHLQKVATLGGALGSYLATYTSGRAPSKEELEARREARKKAISSLIDSQTERRNRMRSVVLSFGGTVGFLGAIQNQPGSQWNAFRLQPSLCLGLAVDWHINAGWGLHFEAMPFNLGSYASLVPGTKTLGKDGKPTDTDATAASVPSPGDAMSPSITLAPTYVVKSADLVVILPGITAGYAAKIGNDASNIYGGAYIGVTTGAYVPIFDFN